MKVFRATGTFKMGRRWQSFSKEVTGEDEDAVKEKVLSIFGSKHRVKRTNIKINNIEEIPEEDVEDMVLQGILEEEE